MKFVCKNGCGFVHENTGGMHWQRIDDTIVLKHGKECPNK